MNGRRDEEGLVTLDELTSVLRAYEGPAEPVVSGARRRPHSRRARRAAALGVALAVAILVGSGLGFGLGSSVTPSGSAGDNVVGFGFLLARNWNVLQSGAVGPGSEGYAIAANIPLKSAVRPGEIPYETLDTLPARGIVIAATFGLRGDPAGDASFPADTLPLRLDAATATPAGSEALVPASVKVFRIRAGVGGSNVDARIYFGSQPSARMKEQATLQLERLVLVAEQVTIAARPTIAPPDHSVTLFGSVDNGRQNEEVEIQAKDCGQSFFRVVAGARTREGGGWSTEFFPGITTTLRAVWKGQASPQVTVRQRAMLRFVSLPSNRTRFRVSVVARAQFWRRNVTIQRFDRRLGRWERFRSVVLTEQAAPGAFVWTSGVFTARLPRGTQLRAVLPASQAGPCYLSGTSLTVRT